jgi:uncharacterized membrane protein YccC
MSTNILAAALVFLIGFIIYSELSRRWKKRAERMLREENEQFARAAKEREIERMIEEDAAKRQAAMTDAMLALVKSLDTNAANGDENKALLSGTVKACEAIAQSTVDLRNEVAAFAKLIGTPKPEPQYPDEQLLKPNSEEEAALAQDTFERVMTRGIPLDQAVTEAKEAAEKKMMFATASFGPEE